MDAITPDAIAGIAGTLLTLAFSYLPGLKDKFEPLPASKKRLIMLGLLVLAAAGALAFTCKLVPECYTLNWLTYLKALGTAVVLNQSVYSVTKPN